jgi:hypothetical protein
MTGEATAVSPAESVTNPKESAAAADQFTDSGKMIPDGGLVAALTQQLAEKDRQIERLLGLLEGRRDKRPPDLPWADGKNAEDCSWKPGGSG